MKLLLSLLLGMGGRRSSGAELARRRHCCWTCLAVLTVSLAIVAIGAAPVEAATIDAASCSRDDVAAAVTAAQNGDTVLIPPGSCTWTTGLASYCGVNGYDASFCRSSTAGDTKHITIQGAGVGQTFILDAIPDTSDPPSLMQWQLSPGGLSRITGIEVRTNRTCVGGPKGDLIFYGETDHFRLDHSKFVAGGACAMLFFGKAGLPGYIRGVLDHNFYDVSRVTVGMYVMQPTWGNLGNGAGDGSWALPDTVGTSEALFFEDSTCYNDQSVLASGIFCFDGWEGNRIVIRHMNMRAAMAGGHGTDSGQRSTRQFEMYENTFTGPDGVSPWDLDGASVPSVMSIRGGVGVVFDNTISITNGLLTGPFNGSNFRDPGGMVNAVYGACTGSNPWDQNTNGTGHLCIDQVGAGYGDLLDTLHTGGAINTATGTASWPRQVAQPTYAWNNTINGVVTEAFSTTANVVVGRDIINGARPGYEPYRYPHPLTMEGSDGTGGVGGAGGAGAVAAGTGGTSVPAGAGGAGGGDDAPASDPGEGSAGADVPAGCGCRAGAAPTVGGAAWPAGTFAIFALWTRRRKASARLRRSK